MSTKVYICNPSKNYICSKIGCHEECYLTANEDFALLTDVCLDNANGKLKTEDFDKLVEYAKGFWRGWSFNCLNSINTN